MEMNIKDEGTVSQTKTKARGTHLIRKYVF